MKIKELQNELLNLLFFKSISLEWLCDSFIIDKHSKEYIFWTFFKKLWKKFSKNNLELEKKFFEQIYFWIVNVNLKIRSIIYSWKVTKIDSLLYILFWWKHSLYWEILKYWFKQYSNSLFSFQSFRKLKVVESNENEKFNELAQEWIIFLYLFTNFLIRNNIKDEEIDYLISKYKYIFLYYYSLCKFFINKYNLLFNKDKTCWFLERNYTVICNFFNYWNNYFEILELYIQKNWKIYWSEINFFQNKFEILFKKVNKIKTHTDCNLYIFNNQDRLKKIKELWLRKWALSLFWLSRVSSSYWWFWSHFQAESYSSIHLNNYNNFIDLITNEIQNWNIKIYKDFLLSTDIWNSLISFKYSQNIIRNFKNTNHINDVQNISRSFENYLWTLLTKINDLDIDWLYKKNVIFSNITYNEQKTFWIYQITNKDLDWFKDWSTLKTFYYFYSTRWDINKIIEIFIKNYFNFVNHQLFIKQWYLILNDQSDWIKKRIVEYLVNSTIPYQDFKEQIIQFELSFYNAQQFFIKDTKWLMFSEKEISHINELLSFMKNDIEDRYQEIYKMFLEKRFK